MKYWHTSCRMSCRKQSPLRCFLQFLAPLVTAVALHHTRETECRLGDSDRSDSDNECSDDEGKFKVGIAGTRQNVWR